MTFRSVVRSGESSSSEVSRGSNASRSGKSCSSRNSKRSGASRSGESSSSESRKGRGSGASRSESSRASDIRKRRIEARRGQQRERREQKRRKRQQGQRPAAARPAASRAKRRPQRSRETSYAQVNLRETPKFYMLINLPLAAPVPLSVHHRALSQRPNDPRTYGVSQRWHGGPLDLLVTRRLLGRRRIGGSWGGCVGNWSL